MLINTWLLKLDQGKKIGLFLSDIAGAFDRVETRALIAKLKRAGVSSKLLKFFSPTLNNLYLKTRIANTWARHHI